MQSDDYNIALHESNTAIEVRLGNFTELNHVFLVYECTNSFALLPLNSLERKIFHYLSALHHHSN